MRCGAVRSRLGGVIARAGSARSILATLVLLLVVARSGTVLASELPSGYEAQQETLRRISHSPGRPLEDTAFIGVNVVGMEDERIRFGQTVIVRNGRIAVIGDGASMMIPAGARQIRAEGAFLLPGLADMHVHSHGSALSAKLFLANGVTTVREMAGRPEYLDWAARSIAGSILAPRIFTTGPVTGGRGDGVQTVTVSTVAGAEEEVKRQFRLGYRMLKPYTFLDARIYAALIRVAKAKGMHVVGHVPYAVGTMGALLAGQDEIAHVHSFHQDAFVGFSRDATFREYVIDPAFIPAITPHLRSRGVSVTSTLVVNQALADSRDLEAFLARPERMYEPSGADDYMRSDSWVFNRMWDGPYLRTIYMPWLRDSLRALHAGGVRIVLGTDSGVTGVVHGFSAHDELELMVASGLSPYQALRTATVNAAALMGEEALWGRVREGMRADLLLIGSDPLGDIRNVRDIKGVMRGGQWLDENDLGAMLAEVRQAVGGRAVAREADAR